MRIRETGRPPIQLGSAIINNLSRPCRAAAMYQSSFLLCIGIGRSFRRTKVHTRYICDKNQLLYLGIQKPRAQTYDNKSIVLDEKTNLHNICVCRRKKTEEDVISYIYLGTEGIPVYVMVGMGSCAVSRVLYRNNVVVDG